MKQEYGATVGSRSSDGCNTPSCGQPPSSSSSSPPCLMTAADFRCPPVDRHDAACSHGRSELSEDGQHGARAERWSGSTRHLSVDEDGSFNFRLVHYIRSYTYCRLMRVCDARYTFCAMQRYECDTCMSIVYKCRLDAPPQVLQTCAVDAVDRE
jgi:hypothetical protein